MQIEEFNPDHLYQMTRLINIHLGAMIPGCSLTEAYIAKHLQRNPGEYVIDPWVIERKTLCLLEKQRVVAAAHLLRYDTGESVGEWYQNAGDVAWLVAWPEHQQAAKALLMFCHEQLRQWQVSQIWAWNGSFAIPIGGGIPDVWPHLNTLFSQAGYVSNPERVESAYGGRLNAIPLPGKAPVEGLRCERLLLTSQGTAFAGYIGDEFVGVCEVVADLSAGEERPIFKTWAELANMQVEDAWQSKGIGSWLVQHAAEWLRLAGCDTIILSVAQDDDERGAGRFYNRFGWQPWTRFQRDWTLPTLDK